MNASFLRIDKWLWYTRFFKSRTLASKICDSGKVRVNGTLINKSHYKLSVGDVLTFPKENDVRVVKVIELGSRRGPAIEAQTLYEDLEPPDAPSVKAEKVRGDARTSPVAERERGSGRPTKAERRAMDRLRSDKDSG
jgi:ribosome-associated heat shock protein Hsp15